MTIWLYENGHLDAPSAISALLPVIDAFHALVGGNKQAAAASFNDFIQVVQGLVDDGLLIPGAGQFLNDLAQGAIDQLIVALPGPPTLGMGVGHTCAVDDAGQAFCWGRNTAPGQLGNGTAQPGSLTPVAVVGGHTFVQVTGGRQHTCGLDDIGHAWCWGENFLGELGDGTNTDRVSPVAVVGGHTFVQVTAADEHVCALDETGQAFCWGRNHIGQLGDGTTMNRSSPVAVFGGHPFAQISGGTLNTCALDRTGQAFCWGANGFLQLGDGTRATSLIPVAVTGGRTFVQIATDLRFACGVEDISGQVLCWGRGDEGQLGDGTSENNTDRATPAAVLGGQSFVQVATGEEHACALDDAGQVLCWGKGDEGQLGDGANTDRATPVVVGGGYTLVQIDAGYRSSCALDGTGQAFCWGNNQFGELGDGTTTNRSTPVPVLSP